MSSQTTSVDTPSVTSSLGSVDGASQLDWLDGLTTGPSGRDHALASLSAAQESVEASTTSATSGLNSCGSSRQESLQSLLASRLVARVDSNGSPLYAMTWREQAMPSGLPIFRLAVSVPRTSGGASSGLPTIPASECRDRARPVVLAKVNKGGRVARMICAQSETARSWPDVVSLNPSFAAWMMGFPTAWQDCMPTATPSSRKSPQSS